MDLMLSMETNIKSQQKILYYTNHILFAISGTSIHTASRLQPSREARVKYIKTTNATHIINLAAQNNTFKQP